MHLHEMRTPIRIYNLIAIAMCSSLEFHYVNIPELTGKHKNTSCIVPLYLNPPEMRASI